MVSNTSFSSPCKNVYKELDKEHTQSRTYNKHGALICRLHSNTESEKATVFKYSKCMWVTVKSIYVTHYIVVFKRSIKTKRSSCANQSIYWMLRVCHLLIRSLHNLSGKWILSTEIKKNWTPLYKLSFQVFPQRMSQHMFDLFQHTSWTTTTVLKVIMYLLPLTHLHWSCLLVRRCGRVLSDGHPSSSPVRNNRNTFS